MSSSTGRLEWDIRGQGRAWDGDEAMERYASTPGKLEMVKGKLLWNQQEREHLLCLLLENVGADRAVEFGSPQTWRDATAKLKA